MKKMIVIAGDAGVYVGMAEGGAEALGADGRVVLHEARHLRRYRVAGGRGDGSATDLAARGIDPAESSYGELVSLAVIVGVRRAYECSEEAAATFRSLP